LWRRIGSGSTLGSISILASGALGAQLIVVLASPILTRLYTPEQFGFLAVFTSILNTVMVVASLRYQVAVPLAKSDRDAVATLMLCVLTGVATALTTLLVVHYFGAAFARLVKVPDYASWFYLLPIAMLLAGWFEVFRFWNTRTRTFAPIAKARFQQSVAMTLVQLGFFRFGVAALLIGQVVGRFSGLTRLVLPFHRSMQGQVRTLTSADLRRQAKEFRRFPVYSTWGTLINVTGRQLPTVFFAALAGPGVAGLYALSQRILATPLSLVSDAISSVFTSRVVPSAGQVDLPGVVRAFHTGLCLLAAVPTLALIIVGQDVFGLVFGAEWAAAGLYAALMAPWIFFVFVSTPLMMVFSVRSRDAELTLCQFLLALARVAALFAGWSMGQAAWAIGLFSLASSIAYVGMLARVYVLAGMSMWSMLKPLAGAFGIAALITLPLLLDRRYPGEHPVLAWGSFVLLAVGYYLWLGREIVRRAGTR